MAKGEERSFMSYRWNDDLQRVEYWDSVEWRASSYAPPLARAVEGTDHPIVSYDDSWCEPVER